MSEIQTSLLDPSVSLVQGRPMKECAWCHVLKPLPEFARHRRAPDGRQRACRECLARNWRRNHNIDERPPKPRRSAYDIIDEQLYGLEQVAAVGDRASVIRKIAAIREELKL